MRPSDLAAATSVAVDARQRHHVYRRTLYRAIENVGSEDALAARLNVSIGQIRFWSAGVSSIPQDVFLKLVDLVLDFSVVGIKERRTRSMDKAQELGRRAEALFARSTRAIGESQDAITRARAIQEGQRELPRPGPKET